MSRDPDEAELFEWLRAEMQAGRREPLGSGYQAVVHRHVGPFGDVVVKSPHEKSLRGALARKAVRREHRVYSRLAGIPGVPRVRGLLDGTHLVLEHVPGPSLRDHDANLRDRERFFAHLLGTIDAMHAAGVAHGDLKRKDNIIVGPDERPYIIDFGIARLRHGEGDVAFRLVEQMDYNAWVKRKYRREFDQISPADAARYRPLMLERIARWVRIPWQMVTLRRARQRWRGRE